MPVLNHKFCVSLYELCPNNDLSSVNINQTILGGVEYVNAANGCSVLNDAAASCPAYGGTLLGSTYINPTALPSGFPGQAPLSTISGTTSLPLGGLSITTLILPPAYTTVITFASGDAAVTTTSSAPTTSGSATSSSSSEVASTPSSGVASTPSSGVASTPTSGAQSRYAMAHTLNFRILSLPLFLLIFWYSRV